MTLLTISDLGKSFTLHERGVVLDALSGVSLTVAAGEAVVLRGPSGAGKSSVLKCIWRSYRPSAGRIIFRCADGSEVDLAIADEHRVLALRHREIAFVTQFLRCVPRTPAVDVVAAPLLRRGIDAAVARGHARELLERLGLPEALWMLPPATFSGGEQQRVNIARGLACGARLILLDEPTASLDAAAADRVLALCAELRQSGAGMLAIVHDHALAERLADRQIVIQAQPAGAEVSS